MRAHRVRGAGLGRRFTYGAETRIWPCRGRDWLDPQGFGVLDYADGGRYDGQWLAGLRHGQGTMTGPPACPSPADADPPGPGAPSSGGAAAGAAAASAGAAGDVYTGSWVKGLRHGRGTCR